MSTIRKIVDEFAAQTRALDSLRAGAASLTATHQRMLAELILVRLAVAMENALSQGLYRVGAGRELPDGTFANTLFPASLLITAQRRLRAGRPKMTWLDASDVCDALRAVLDPSDKTITNLRKHGLVLSQIRKVRNHIVHKNRTSLPQFQSVVRTVYGAKLNSVTPGQLLLTPRSAPQCLLEKFLTGARIAVKETFST